MNGNELSKDESTLEDPFEKLIRYTRHLTSTPYLGVKFMRYIIVLIFTAQLGARNLERQTSHCQLCYK